MSIADFLAPAAAAAMAGLAYAYAMWEKKRLRAYKTQAAEEPSDPFEGVVIVGDGAEISLSERMRRMARADEFAAAFNEHHREHGHVKIVIGKYGIIDDLGAVDHKPKIES